MKFIFFLKEHNIQIVHSTYTRTSFHSHNIFMANSAHYIGNYFYNVSNKISTMEKLEVQLHISQQKAMKVLMVPFICMRKKHNI